MRSPTHTKKHLQRALKAPCRCLKRRTDTRAGRTAIAFVQRLRRVECVCVCVYTFIWFYQIKDVKTYTAWKIIFHLHTNTFCLIRRQRYKLLRKATNLLVKNVSRGKKNHAENNKGQAAERRDFLKRNSPREWKEWTQQRPLRGKVPPNGLWWGETFAFGNPLFASIKARME